MRLMMLGAVSDDNLDLRLTALIFKSQAAKRQAFG